MKRFLLLLAAVGLVSCTETLDEGGPNEIPSQLEQLQRRFDFSEVDTEGLEIKKTYEAQYNESGRPLSDALAFEYAHPDLAVVVGEINKCLWLGLFDRESGQLKCQYTDIEHPVSYSAYGVEYEYGVGKIFGIYFENDNVAITLYYPKARSQEARLDLIAFDENKKAYRSLIAEDSSSPSIGVDMIDTIITWLEDTICLDFVGLNYYGSLLYNISNKKILCNLREEKYPIYGIDSSFFGSLRMKRISLLSTPSYTDGNILVSPLNLLHSGTIVFYNNGLVIMEHQCTYDSVATTEENIKLFETYTGDSSRAPRYSLEYRTRTDDHITAVVTQTEYDGTVTTKTVDARLENDELKVEVQ